MTECTREEVLSEIARELVMRRKVFPKWVEIGRITQEQSDTRINRLQAAYDYVVDNWPREQRDKP